MPNQLNFDESLNQPPGKSISRVETNNEVVALYQPEYSPVKFGIRNSDFVEFHFYEKNSNALVQTFRLNTKELQENDFMYVRQYGDNPEDNEAVVNVRKLIDAGELIVAPGYYNVMVYFMAREVGDLYKRPLSLSKISPNRKEVVLEFKQNFNESQRQYVRREIREFVEPSMQIQDAVALVKQMFGDALDNTGTEAETLTQSDIENRFREISPQHYAKLYENPAYAPEKLVVIEETQQFIKDGLLQDQLLCVYTELYNFLLDAQSRGDRRIQVSQMDFYINRAIDIVFNATKQRFPATVDTR
ncbi:MAG: hypothetical protein VW683_00355 [Betaproteobacteria bacterium]|jgi:hypothetical protein